MILVILFTTTILNVLYYYKCAVCSLQYRKENKVFYRFIVLKFYPFYPIKIHSFPPLSVILPLPYLLGISLSLSASRHL
jgi:hypothetical protein